MGRYGVLFCGRLFCLWGAYGIDLWAAEAAVPSLWAIYGALWLRCWTFMDIWGAVAAMWDLWGIYGLLWLRRGTYG